MQTIKLYYSSSKKNWGDQLSPVICKKVSGCDVVYADVTDCDMIAIGSILSRVKEHFFARKIHVWGSGFIEPVRKHKTRHYIHALRGKKSAALLTNAEVKVFGDPGLLCNLLIPNHNDIPKQFDLGIIPHYSEREHPEFIKFMNKNPGIAFIDVFSDTIPFLQKLASCRFILSSSLHGLIASDSLGIPNCRFILSGNIVGGDFKYEDYYSIYDMPLPKFITLDEFSLKLKDKITANYERPSLDEIKQSMINAFPFPK
jgi:pyruvyltransferase